MNRPIRVLIANSDINFSRQLQSFLDQQEDIRVIYTVRDGQGAVNLCREAWPDLVLIDLHLPVLDSIRAIQAILAQNERIKILGLSSIPDDRYALEAIKVGASGYVEATGADGQASCQAIVEAIRLVAGGEVLVNPALAFSILQEFRRLAG